MLRLWDRLRGLPGRERERRLVQASADYMHGKISLRDLQRAEQRYGTDYLAVARALGRRES